MLRIPCPHCGPRDGTEFTYGGAALPRPDTSGDVDHATWDRYLYLRDDPAGAHREYWHHTVGCRQWLTVSRDTVTHEILDVRGPPTGAGGGAS